jgi:serine/threonine protein kinase
MASCVCDYSACVDGVTWLGPTHPATLTHTCARHALACATIRRIPENWVVHILRQLVEGLHVLHFFGFVHLDLSLENAMFDVATGPLEE